VRSPSAETHRKEVLRGNAVQGEKKSGKKGGGPTSGKRRGEKCLQTMTGKGGARRGKLLQGKKKGKRGGEKVGGSSIERQEKMFGPLWTDKRGAQR